MKKETWLDRAISWASPERGFRRLQARKAHKILASFEGARSSHRTAGWKTAGQSINSDLRLDNETLRNRARDLVANNPFASKGKEVLVANIVGTGIRAKFPKGFAPELKAAWERFVNECDYEGKTHFYGLQEQVAATVVESGEALILKRLAKSSRGLGLPLQLQVLEPDYLDMKKDNKELDGGNYLVQGVEFNSADERVAYHLFKRHPGDGKRSESVRVPAGDVLHVFQSRRPGQVRGVTRFAPVLLKLRDLDEYDDAELQAKKVQACFASFITRQDPASAIADLAETTASGKPIQQIEPGQNYYLSPGEGVEFSTATHSQGYPDYMRMQLRAVASGLGIPYELLTGDLSQVNYSSSRVGMLSFHGMVEQLRWNMFIPGFCEKIWQWFLTVAPGAAPDGVNINWTAPRYNSVDPVKDRQATLLGVRSGLLTLPEAISEEGYDADEQIEEIRRFNEKLDAAGIVLDTDPRRVTKTGVQQANQTSQETL